MRSEVKILTANLRKMEGTQHSIMNDEEFKDYSLLLMTEPYLFVGRDNKYRVAPLAHTY
jgi:hypothetical protein